MEKSLSWEANLFSATQEILRISSNLNLHNHVYNSLTPVPNLSQIDTVHVPTSHFLKIRLNIILPSTPGSSKWFLSLRFPPLNLCLHLSFPPYVHLILLDMITRIIFGEQYRSVSFSLCSLLHSPVTSYLLVPNNLLSTLFWNTLSLCSLLSASDQISYPYRTTWQSYSYVYLNIYIF